MNRRFSLWRLALLLSLVWAHSLFAADTNAPLVRESELRLPSTGQTGFTLLPPEQTGIFFTNALDEWASAENRVLNNGSGVAAGDYDNDGRVDLFFCSLNNQNRLFKNLGNWRFVDATAEAGLKFPAGYYRAAVFADLNGDGSLDLLVGSVGNGVLCFLNDGHGHFTNATTQAGTASAHATESLALADIDGNGTLDLYVANNRNDDIRDWLRIPVMMVNKKPTVPPALRDRISFESGQLQEFGEPDILYLNDGHAHFTPVPWTGGAFLDEQGQPLPKAPLDWGLTAAFRDLNNDGLPDLYVCNDYWTPDRIWLNAGDGHFRAIAPLAIRKICASSMGVDFADINRDGYLDIFAVDMLSRSPELRKRQIVAKRAIAPKIGDIENRVQATQNTLLLNRGDGTYAEIACLAGVQASDWSWSPLFLDVDLDGYEDLLITAGHIRDIQDIDATEKIRALQDTWRRNASPTNLQRAFVEAKHEHTKLYPPLNMPIVAFRNLGNLRFEEITNSWGLVEPAVNHGIAMADLDGDGDLDLIVNRLGYPAAIYRNDTIAPRISVRLRGEPPNTEAIGARMELSGGPVSNQKMEVTSGGTYLSSHDTLRTFAVGKGGPRSRPLSLHVSWRNGSTTDLANIHANHLYEITEPNSRFTLHASPETNTAPVFQDVSPLLNHTHHDDPFDDFARQPLLPRKLSQNGPGVTWCDLNGDGWEDLLIGSGKGGKMAIFLNREGERFDRLNDPLLDKPLTRDLTTILAFRTSQSTHIIAGAASYEDGDTNSPCVMQFSVTKSNTLTRSANDLPSLPSSVGPLAIADIDGQGHLALFVGGQIIPGHYPEAASSLLFREMNGQWQIDATNSRALAKIGLVNSAVWSDLTGDGLPELLLACEWGPLKIFRNDHGNLVPWDPSITSHASRFTLHELTGFWTGITTGDFDEDGQLDMIACNWGFNSEHEASPNRPLTIFYGELGQPGRTAIVETEWDPIRNQLTPRVSRDALATTLPSLVERFSTHTAYSRATVSDILGSSTTGRASVPASLSVTTLATTLFLNRGTSFEAHELPLEAQIAPAFSAQVADMDGDGHEDVFISQNFFAFAREDDRCDAGRGLWLRGDGHGNLSPVPGQQSGIKVYGEQRGAALADFDHDRRVDLVVTQNGAQTKLYRNLHAEPGLRVHISGAASNIDGIGVTLRLRYPTGFGPAREIHAGSGYWSQDSSVPILGFSQGKDGPPGRQSRPTAIWTRWPGGATTETPIPPDATEVTIRHPGLR